MTTKRAWRGLWMAWLIVVSLTAARVAAQPAEGILKKGDRVAIVGDSITEQKIYSRFIETYLLACLPQLELQTIQLGWSGETAPQFHARMANDLAPWKPNVATFCYGMNDGHYLPYSDAIGKDYEGAMRQIVATLKKNGVRVVVGSPGIVDPDYFPPDYILKFSPKIQGKVYNENLDRLRQIDRNLAAQTDCPFADVYGPMMRAMDRIKADQGPKAVVVGQDGIHPWDNGHLIMAYAFLKGMGLGGEIGTIELDRQAGTATASDGHRVLSAAPGRVELESTRYPFCFAPVNSKTAQTSWTTRSVLAYLPFNQDLNRLTLRVKNLGAERAAVQWGEQSKTFTRAQLESGINLAAEFLDNPFSEPFARLNEAVARKEAFETYMIKQLVTQFRNLPSPLLGRDAGVTRALDEVRSALDAEDQRLHAEARAAIVPVRHTIGITVQ